MHHTPWFLQGWLSSSPNIVPFKCKKLLVSTHLQVHRKTVCTNLGTRSETSTLLHNEKDREERITIHIFQAQNTSPLHETINKPDYSLTKYVSTIFLSFSWVRYFLRPFFVCSCLISYSILWKPDGTTTQLDYSLWSVFPRFVWQYSTHLSWSWRSFLSLTISPFMLYRPQLFNKCGILRFHMSGCRRHR